MLDFNDPPVFRLPPFQVRRQMTALSETIDWGLQAFGVPQVWAKTRGGGVRVAVLDTGIDANHPDLKGAVVAMRDFSGSLEGAVDRQGHGTHVAGTIAARQNQQGVVGVAPQCQLLVGKVLGDDGAGSEQSVAAGIHWAVSQRADIISMSLGSSRASRRIGEAVEAANRAGVFLITAAGNEGRPDSINFPARRRETIAVAATNRSGQATSFSSRGPQVDIAAPGEDILSTWPGGRYARLSGTSMATPFVSGVVALLLAAERRPRAPALRDVKWLREQLARTAVDAGPPGKDNALGWGLIDPGTLLASEKDRPASRLPKLSVDVVVNGLPASLVLTDRPSAKEPRAR